LDGALVASFSVENRGLGFLIANRRRILYEGFKSGVPAERVRVRWVANIAARFVSAIGLITASFPLLAADCLACFSLSPCVRCQHSEREEWRCARL